MPHSAKSTTKMYSLSSSSISRFSSKLDQEVVIQSYITKNSNILSLVTNHNLSREPQFVTLDVAT